MPVPEGWDATAALAACPVVEWEGHVWRMHKQKYSATDPGGSRMVSGRYHRGLDQFPEDQVFSALYLATSPEVCLGELYRHITPELLPSLNNYRLSKLFVRLMTVLVVAIRRFWGSVSMISCMILTTKPHRVSGLLPLPEEGRRNPHNLSDTPGRQPGPLSDPPWYQFPNHGRLESRSPALRPTFLTPSQNALKLFLHFLEKALDK